MTIWSTMWYCADWWNARRVASDSGVQINIFFYFIWLQLISQDFNESALFRIFYIFFSLQNQSISLLFCCLALARGPNMAATLRDFRGGVLFATFWLAEAACVIGSSGLFINAQFHYQVLSYDKIDFDVTVGQCAVSDSYLSCAIFIRHKTVRRWSQSLSTPIATVCFVPLSYDSAW